MALDLTVDRGSRVPLYFQLAQQLEAAGQAVGLLAFFDTLYPQRGWVRWLNRIGRLRLIRHVRTLWRLGRGRGSATSADAFGPRAAGGPAPRRPARVLSR